MDLKKFEERKIEHIRHSLDLANQAVGLSGLESVHLRHEALPDLDFQDIDLTSTCLGNTLSTPFYIPGMTAGHDQAFQINRTLALACQERGWVMGVGSLRRDLENEVKGGGLDQWKKLREETPQLILIANLGISQLITAKISRVRRIVDELGAQALAIHLNSLQEVMQPEGTPQFRGSFETVKRYCEELGIPVVLKETGCGFSRTTLERVSSIGLSAIDLSGLGGTHWGRIEGSRAEARSLQSLAASTFANWGESTVDSLEAAVSVLPQSVEIWASGGVRTGLDAAKLIALGAHRVGYAKPALEAALLGLEPLKFWMKAQEFELKVALFCTGAVNCNRLKQFDVKERNQRLREK